MLDVFASERHYLDHLAPVVHALAPEARVLVPTAGLGDYAREAMPGIDVRIGAPTKDTGNPVLVASYRDRRRLAAGRKYGLLEHGAGQTYRGEATMRHHPGYPGGVGFDDCAVILSPGPHAARAWRDAYPDVPIVELGGPPRLDRWYQARTGPSEPRVGVSFHWPCRLVAEAGATWPFWLATVTLLACDHPMLYHAHPRAWAELGPLYDKRSLTASRSFADLLDLCSVYVCDNSSTMFEFAALDRPVVCLDSPTYRRDVKHGLRFWDAAPGVRVSNPDHLASAVDHAVCHPEASRATRHHAVTEAYGGWPDGHATERAVRGIEESLL